MAHAETDTDTQPGARSEPAPVPSPIFFPEDPLPELWVRAYQGEVLGEALFAKIADTLDDPDRAAKMRVLSTLERRTKEAIAPSLERAGISTDPDPRMFTLAHALSQGVAWDDFLDATQSITEQYIPQRYNAQTELKMTVQAGPQEKKFELTSDPKRK